MYAQNLYQDDFIQQLLSNPNLQIVNQPYSSSTPIITQHIDRLPIISAQPPPPSVCSNNYQEKKPILYLS